MQIIKSWSADLKESNLTRIQNHNTRDNLKSFKISIFSMVKQKNHYQICLPLSRHEFIELRLFFTQWKMFTGYALHISKMFCTVKMSCFQGEKFASTIFVQ